jgi:uncharacterized tellurite resistance protein B-like protein
MMTDENAKLKTIVRAAYTRAKQKASWIVTAATNNGSRTQKVYKTFKYAKRYAETMARKGYIVAMTNTITGSWALVRV